MPLHVKGVASSQSRQRIAQQIHQPAVPGLSGYPDDDIDDVNDDDDGDGDDDDVNVNDDDYDDAGQWNRSIQQLRQGCRNILKNLTKDTYIL